jgi:hypothetical protein
VRRHLGFASRSHRGGVGDQGRVVVGTVVVTGIVVVVLGVVVVVAGGVVVVLTMVVVVVGADVVVTDGSVAVVDATAGVVVTGVVDVVVLDDVEVVTAVLPPLSESAGARNTPSNATATITKAATSQRLRGDLPPTPRAGRPLSPPPAPAATGRPSVGCSVDPVEPASAVSVANGPVPSYGAPQLPQTDAPGSIGSPHTPQYRKDVDVMSRPAVDDRFS